MYWLDELSSILASCLESVRVGLESTVFNDSLVVHQLVTLVVWKGEEIIGFGVSDDLMRFDDLSLARFLLRLLNFVKNILAHDVVIQLALAFTDETEAANLALDFALFGLVPIILGTFRHKFHDVIVSIQFAGKLSEIVS